ncbi:MAG: hypothetical protein AB1898_22830 [Acidobacteriota bacterium]
MSAHAEFLRAASNDEELATHLKFDFRKARLTQREFRVLEFVEKLSLCPWLMVRSDFERLQEEGLSDSEILHVVLGAAHFNYFNRMADGIGIRLEYRSEIPEFKVPGEERISVPAAGPTPADQPRSVGVAGGTAWIRIPQGDGRSPSGDGPQNLFHALNDNPPARDLVREWRTYQLKGTPALDACRRSELALFVSGLNHCDYSARWFASRIRSLGASSEACRLLAAGKRPDGLGLLGALIFAHAERLTREPWTTREFHIEELRKAGLDDHGILQLTMLCSYLSFENRVALGLGVATEEGVRGADGTRA